MRWRAVSAWTLLIPGITSYSSATAPGASMRSSTSMRAVVERRVAPHEEAAAPVLAELVAQRRAPDARARRARQSSTAAP